MDVRDTVMRSLTAISGEKEAAFYTQLFRAQEPERFALLVLDQRCLQKPLLEALISDMRILSELRLTPVLLIGALDEDRSQVRVLGQRLLRQFEKAGINTAKLDCSTYGLADEVRRRTRDGAIILLELTERRGAPDLSDLVKWLSPNKVIFLQPSGGLRREGQRLAAIALEELAGDLQLDSVSPGQVRFLDTVRRLSAASENIATVYVIASPLNLLQELFTTKGSGTMVRRTAQIISGQSYDKLDRKRLKNSIEEAFERELRQDFFERQISYIFLERDYRGGAIFTPLSGLPYLSKFWVARAAQGEGIARDIWATACAQIPSFFWRSRKENPFNSWYMSACDGMQNAGPWRVFWIGLSPPEIPHAISAAANAPLDFAYEQKA